MRLNVNQQLEQLQTVDESYWTQLLKQYLVNVCFSVHSKTLIK